MKTLKLAHPTKYTKELFEKITVTNINNNIVTYIFKGKEYKSKIFNRKNIVGHTLTYLYVRSCKDAIMVNVID
jgi:hypothetical protein